MNVPQPENGQDKARVVEMLLGRSDLVSFTVHHQGQPLMVLLARGDAITAITGAPAPAPPSYEPPPPAVVKIRTMGG